MDTIVRINLELEDGTVIQPFHNFKIQQSIGNHAYFELRCPMRTFEADSEPLLNRTLDLFGKMVKVGFHTGANQENSQYFFKGIITEISVEKYQGIGGDLLIKGYSPTILLEEGASYATFLGKTISQSINLIMQGIPSNLLEAEIQLDEDRNMGYRVQYKESSFEFLKKIAKVYSQWIYFDGKSLFFGKAPDANPINLKFGIDVSSLKFDLKMIPSKFSYINYNTISDQIFESESSQASDSSLDDFSNHVRDKSNSTYDKKIREIVAFRPENQNTMDDIVKIVKKRNEGKYMVISGTCNNPDLKIGSIIQIDGPNRANPNEDDSYGKYRIISLDQNINGGGSYSCKFEALSSYVTSPPTDVYAGYEPCEDQFAKVKENNDPDKLGRIQVQFPWQSGEEMTPWLDCTQVYAGKGRGFYFVPEIDDQVIVGFINNNPNMPYVKGSVYRKDNAIPEREIDENNKRKVIRMNEHFYIELNEETTIDGVQTAAMGISSVDSDGNKMNFMVIGQDSETGVKIKSKDHIIVIDGHEIKIKSEGNISIISDKELSLKATGSEGIVIDSGQGDISLKGGNIKIDAQQDMSVSALNAKIEANVGVTVKGSASAEISSSGQTTVKGSIVMIN